MYYDNLFIYQKKLKNNKDNIILEFNLINWEVNNNQIPKFNVALQIYRKRKRFEIFESYVHSGSGDISSLIFAKEMLLEFEEEYLSNEIYKEFNKIELHIYSLDKRRLNIYKRYLIPLGYKLNTQSNENYLYKVLERNENN